MKRSFVVALLAVALGCNAGPRDPWLGTWNLLTFEGQAAPADTTLNGYRYVVVRRTLELLTGDVGYWSDSTLVRAVAGGPQPCDLGYGAPLTRMCNMSGFARVAWTAVGDTLTVTRYFGMTTGYVVPVKTFVRRADGHLLKTDDVGTEEYRR